MPPNVAEISATREKQAKKPLKKWGQWVEVTPRQAESSTKFLLRARSKPKKPLQNGYARVLAYFLLQC